MNAAVGWRMLAGSGLNEEIYSPDRIYKKYQKMLKVYVGKNVGNHPV